MQLTKTKRKDYPFTYGGSTICDYYSGQVVHGYAGKVRVGDALFETGIDKEYGERFWNCLDHQYFRF